MDSPALCQISQPGGKRREYKIKAEDLSHGDRNICRRLKGILSVEGEVPQDRQDKRCQIGDPIILNKDFQNCKAGYLYEACRYGE